LDLRRFFFISLILTSLSTLSAMPAQTLGTIHGTVLDNRGVPVSGARVNAALTRQPGQSVAHYVETDATGHFSIDGLAWGEYKVFVMREQSGYPNMHFSFYSNDVFPTASVTPNAPIADLQIQLGPRAGTLTGSISDGASGAPISADLKLIRAEAPKKWISIGVAPLYRVLVPSNTEVLLEVTASGFKTWTLSSPLLLHSGEEIQLDIPMERSDDPNLHPSRFLIPEGYRGWVLLDFNAKDAPLTPVENGIQVFKVQMSGAISTSSCGPEKGASNEFLYYANDGSLRPVPMEYRNGKGMIWGQHEGIKNGVKSQFGFFVGTEQEYKKYEMWQTHPGLIPPD
jgi:hypothetical protein